MRICVDLRRSPISGVGRVAFHVAHLLERLQADWALQMSYLVSPDTQDVVGGLFPRSETIVVPFRYFSKGDIFELPRLLAGRIDVYWANPFYVSPFLDAVLVVTAHDAWPLQRREWLPCMEDVAREYGADVPECAQLVLDQVNLGALVIGSHGAPSLFERYVFTLFCTAMDRARIVTSGSHHSLEQLAGIFPQHQHKLRLLSPSVRLAESAHSRRFDTSNTDHLLTVAKHDPRKNLAFLLEALSELHRIRGNGGRPIHTHLVGNMEYRPGGAALVQRAAELSRGRHRVTVHGVVDEPTLNSAYASSTLLVMPSLDEGFGLPLLEAMEAGLPALVARKGALPEVGRGFVSYGDVRSHQDFAAQIEATLAHRDESRDRALAAQEYALGAFSSDSAESHMRCILHELATSRGLIP